MPITRLSVGAILMAAFVGFVLYHLMSQHPGRIDSANESTVPEMRLPTIPERAAPAHSINPIRPLPFRDHSSEPLAFRVLDLVTGKPIAGASICPSASGDTVYSEHPTDVDGRGMAVLPEGCSPPCDIFVTLPAAHGGGAIAATFPKSPDTDIVLPVYASLVVQTTMPHLPAGTAPPGDQAGGLWCASWPAPQEVLKAEIPANRLAQLRADFVHGPIIYSHNTNTNGAVHYHDSLKRVEGCDASKLICLREDVKLGAEHTFHLAYGGEVLISHYIPGLDWNMKVRAHTVRGEIRRVVMEPLEARRIRLIVHDERGAPIAGSHVVVVTRWDLGPTAPQPDGSFFVFTPEGTDKRIAVRRHALETDARGEAGLWALGNGKWELYASATKPGHMGTGVDLWSGVAMSGEAAFKLELRRAQQEWALLKVGGQPLAHCNSIKVTDLDPISLLGQIDYPAFTSDEMGRASFEQLVPGHRYAIMAATNTGLHHQEFKWAPGVVIAF